MSSLNILTQFIYKRYYWCRLQPCVIVGVNNLSTGNDINLCVTRDIKHYSVRNTHIFKHLDEYRVRYFCTVSDRRNGYFTNRRDAFQSYIRTKKERLQVTEQRIKARGNVFLRDFERAKNKVRAKVEKIIERENIYTVPNFLCVSRILLSPYLGMLIVQAEFQFALAILGVAAVTDLLDGWIARTWESQSSKMGSFLDPMADKVLIATLFLTLTYADLIPIALTSLIVMRDVVLVGAGFVIRYRSLPPPRTISRYFDVTHATAQLAPTFVSKVNTVVQLLLVGSTLAAPVFQYVGHPLLQSLWYITGATTVAAGLSYIISKNTYHILNKHKK